jgi:hypothetical protein
VIEIGITTTTDEEIKTAMKTNGGKTSITEKRTTTIVGIRPTTGTATIGALVKETSSLSKSLRVKSLPPQNI